MKFNLRQNRRRFIPFHLITLLLIGLGFLFLTNCSDDSDKIDLNEKEYYFFTDDFETGDLSHTENDFIWAGNNVVVEETPNGTMGLKFVFGPDLLNEDSWQEQRFPVG